MFLVFHRVLNRVLKTRWKDRFSTIPTLKQRGKFVNFHLKAFNRIVEITVSIILKSTLALVTDILDNIVYEIAEILVFFD